MSKPKINTCLTPELIHQYEIKDHIVVVIDVLRATTTINSALSEGALSVIPVAEVEATRKFVGDEFVFAGERNGQMVEGFDHGNSPLEYKNGVVRGKHLVLTTTNGTKAISLSDGAHAIVIGAFVNLDAVCAYLREQNKSVLLFCAGWKNKVNLEDSLFAGAVAHQVAEGFDIADDSTLMAVAAYKCEKDNLFSAMQDASHFKRLSGLGVVEDLKFCLTLNLFDQVPVLQGDKILTNVR